uniref:Uncharacterized protein n=1 Tax=Tetraselmis sp. GSL018 TaxID=582737 RepID=A0A061QSR4_9CHLO
MAEGYPSQGGHQPPPGYPVGPPPPAPGQPGGPPPGFSPPPGQYGAQYPPPPGQYGAQSPPASGYGPPPPGYMPNQGPMAPAPPGYQYVEVEEAVPDPAFLCLAVFMSIVFFPFGILFCLCIPSRGRRRWVLQPIHGTYH